jgi:hypothetical protein
VDEVMRIAKARDERHLAIEGEGILHVHALRADAGGGEYESYSKQGRAAHKDDLA